MRWAIWLSAISMLLVIVDGIVHLVEMTNAADILRQSSSEWVGISELRATCARQTVWLTAAASVVVAQIAIIWIATKDIAQKSDGG